MISSGPYMIDREGGSLRPRGVLSEEGLFSNMIPRCVRALREGSNTNAMQRRRSCFGEGSPPVFSAEIRILAVRRREDEMCVMRMIASSILFDRSLSVWSAGNAFGHGKKGNALSSSKSQPRMRHSRIPSAGQEDNAWSAADLIKTLGARKDDKCQ